MEQKCMDEQERKDSVWIDEITKSAVKSGTAALTGHAADADKASFGHGAEGSGAAASYGQTIEADKVSLADRHQTVTDKAAASNQMLNTDKAAAGRHSADLSKAAVTGDADNDNIEVDIKKKNPNVKEEDLNIDKFGAGLNTQGNDRVAVFDDQVVDKKYVDYIKENNNNAIQNNAKTLAGVILGSVINAVNISIFVGKGGFLPSGLSGLVVLIQRIVEKFAGIAIPFAPLSLALNIAAALFAVKTLGKKYTLYSFLSVIIYSLLTDMIPDVNITDDRLLLAVFGGIIAASGMGVVLNAGASQGGSDFIAMTFSVKKGINTFGYVTACNIALMVISGAIFGWESALYTIIFLYVNNQTLNVVYTRYAKKTLLVITEKPHLIADDIRSKTNHSSTIFKGEGGFSKSDTYMLYTIIRADELNFVRKRIRAIDKTAFINVLNSSLVTGNFFIRSFR